MDKSLQHLHFKFLFLIYNLHSILDKERNGIEELFLGWVNNHREFFGENEVSKLGKEVQKGVATTYVTMHMKGHLPFDFLPLSHHFVSLESVVPPLQLHPYVIIYHFITQQLVKMSEVKKGMKGRQSSFSYI